MNLKLNAVYFCATSGQRWGKGLTIKEAKQAAGLTTQAQEKKVQFYVMAAILENTTPDELENLRQCITANQVDGSPKYYDADRSYEDENMIKEKHIGWLTIEKNYGS